MRILLVFLVALPLLASNLLTYNVYERSDRVDIMLSFDSPYDGNLSKQNLKNATQILLSGLSLDADINKSVNSAIFQNLFITANNDNTAAVVDLRWNEPISISASKTNDRFGLRLRVTKQGALPIISPTIKTKKDIANIDYSSYLIVIATLAVLLFILVLLKRKIARKRLEESAAFTISDPVPTKKKPITKTIKDLGEFGANVEVLYEKNLDTSNKVALLKFENRRYLVLYGSSNVLLDKFGEDNIETQDDFEVFFEENKQKLNKYIQNRQNSLNAYKDMMSKD